MCVCVCVCVTRTAGLRVRKPWRGPRSPRPSLRADTWLCDSGDMKQEKQIGLLKTAVRKCLSEGESATARALLGSYVTMREALRQYEQEPDAPGRRAKISTAQYDRELLELAQMWPVAKTLVAGLHAAGESRELAGSPGIPLDKVLYHRMALARNRVCQNTWYGVGRRVFCYLFVLAFKYACYY